MVGTGIFRFSITEARLFLKMHFRFYHAKVEHVFTVIKGQFRYQKRRYRGLWKQTAKLNMLFALANLLLADRPCLSV